MSGQDLLARPLMNAVSQGNRLQEQLNGAEKRIDDLMEKSGKIIGTYAVHLAAAQAHIAELEALALVWRPISNDNLPPLDKRVLVCDKFETWSDCRIESGFAGYDPDEWFWESDTLRDDITAWAKLPAPYKENLDE